MRYRAIETWRQDEVQHRTFSEERAYRNLMRKIVSEAPIEELAKIFRLENDTDVDGNLRFRTRTSGYSEV